MPAGISSAHTSIDTSMEELNARVTCAFMVTMLPSRMGSANDTLSTDAVTTMRFECFCAAMAAAISIKCSSRPPIRLLSVLVSLGSTISVITVVDSRAYLGWGIVSVITVLQTNYRKLTSASETRQARTQSATRLIFQENYRVLLNKEQDKVLPKQVCIT